MGLRIYKGDEASRDYENEFFREFASSLAGLFKEEGLDGILIGHPKVPGNAYLKPDCVLITPRRLIIIDFKKHSGKLVLPSEGDFEIAAWEHDGIRIDGGTTSNPFVQLKRQRDWMAKEIGDDVYSKYDARIACLVCFQEDMRIVNGVPGKYKAWFSVTDKYGYPNRIFDMLNLNDDTDVDIDEVFSHFEAKPYRDYYSVDFAKIKAINEAEARRARADAREYKNTQKVKELEQKIKRLKNEKQSAANAEKIVAEMQQQLEVAKTELSAAKKEASDARKDFDDRKHEYDLVQAKAVRAVAEAERAREETRQAEERTRQVQIEKETAIEKAKIKAQSDKRRAVLALFLAIILLVGIVVVLLMFNSKQKQEELRIAEVKAQLEEDYKNGRQCIPVERVADFSGYKGVCVDFYASYINDSSKYVFVDNARGGSFTAMIPKIIISESEAKAQYLNKHLEVRGDIKEYNGSYEILVTNNSQITIRE